PSSGRGMLIIDEAHRLRHLATRRATLLADWIAGRPTLLLSGTPIINRRSDLIAILRLVLPDDALRLDGIASLEALVESSGPPAPLRRLLIRSTDGSRGIPVNTRLLLPTAPECSRGEERASAIARLALGDEPAVRRLLATVLLDAAS